MKTSKQANTMKIGNGLPQPHSARFCSVEALVCDYKGEYRLLRPLSPRSFLTPTCMAHSVCSPVPSEGVKGGGRWIQSECLKKYSEMPALWDYGKHAVVKSYRGNEIKNSGGMLGRLSDIKCRKIVDPLKLMFLTRPALARSWEEWSNNVNTNGHNPFGELFISRVGGVIEPVTELYIDGAFAQ